MIETTLLEPSIADVLKAIETAVDLSASRRTHFSCSLRQICTYLNRPPDIVPARWSAIKNAVYALHAARLGANPKTLANHKSNVRAALVCSGEKPAEGGCAADAGVGRLDGQDRRSQSSQTAVGLCEVRLGGKGRTCGRQRRGTRRVHALPERDHALGGEWAARRVIARAWNACVREIREWPRQGLIEPPVKRLTEMAWESFPKCLREEIESYLAGFKTIRRGVRGKRIRPCKEFVHQDPPA